MRLTFKSSIIAILLSFFSLTCFSQNYIWVHDVINYYLKDDIDKSSIEYFLEVVENNLGINHNSGNLDILKTYKAEYEITNALSLADKSFIKYLYQRQPSTDTVTLAGINSIYAELCVCDLNQYGEKLIRYFENGYYPNSIIMKKRESYYNFLMLYLDIVSYGWNGYKGLINILKDNSYHLKVNQNAELYFSNSNITSLKTAISVSIELDSLIKNHDINTNGILINILPDDEEYFERISKLISFYINYENYARMFSYKWYKDNVSQDTISLSFKHWLLGLWQHKVKNNRVPSPLCLKNVEGFKSDDLDSLFQHSFELLKHFDSPDSDLLILAILKSWISKQSERSVSTEERIKYLNLIDEINVSATGKIFYNLYASREPIQNLKKHSRIDTDSTSNNLIKLYIDTIQPQYNAGMTYISNAWEDLEAILGIQHDKSNSNYLFYRYRGELEYYFELFKFNMSINNIDIDMLSPEEYENRCLKHLRTAFKRNSNIQYNHVMLLHAYLLLFRKLSRSGYIDKTVQYEEELRRLEQKPCQLGLLVSYEDDDRFYIYKTIAKNYLKYDYLEERALNVAKRLFSLSKSRYLAFSKSVGYEGGIYPGLPRDDYERAFELLMETSEALDIPIEHILDQNDILRYQKMRELRK